MLKTESHGWGVTQRRTSDDGEAARKEALAWLEANADENAGAEIVLRRVPESSGGLGVARDGDELVGVVVTTGPSAYVEARDGAAVADLLAGVAKGLKRIWCRAGLRGDVQAWAAANGGDARSENFVVLRAARIPDAEVEGARFAVMDDLLEIETCARAFADERGVESTRDWPSVVARGEVAVLDRDDQLASIALKLGQTTRLGCIGGNWTAPAQRRQGLARHVTAYLLQSVLDSRTVAQALVEEDNTAALALYESLGFARDGGVHCLQRDA